MLHVDLFRYISARLWPDPCVQQSCLQIDLRTDLVVEEQGNSLQIMVAFCLCSMIVYNYDMTLS